MQIRHIAGCVGAFGTLAQTRRQPLQSKNDVTGQNRESQIECNIYALLFETGIGQASLASQLPPAMIAAAYCGGHGPA